MADDVALAQAGEFDVHFRLRPLLRDIATAGLAMQSGIDLDRQPERAREGSRRRCGSSCGRIGRGRSAEGGDR